MNEMLILRKKPFGNKSIIHVTSNRETIIWELDPKGYKELGRGKNISLRLFPMFSLEEIEAMPLKKRKESYLALLKAEFYENGKMILEIEEVAFFTQKSFSLDQLKKDYFVTGSIDGQKVLLFVNQSTIGTIVWLYSENGHTKIIQDKNLDINYSPPYSAAEIEKMSAVDKMRLKCSCPSITILNGNGIILELSDGRFFLETSPKEIELNRL